MIYIFDIDGTLCSGEKDYHKAKPFKERIAVVNKLYDEGHTILLDTARGSTTGIDHSKMTTLQLSRWGVKYHRLRTGVKFFGDFYIGDEAINDKDFFSSVI